MPTIDSPVRSSSRRGAVIAGFVAVILLGGVAGAALLMSYKILPPPGTAPVIADEENSTYASTPCIVANTLDRELINNRSEVDQPDKELELKPYANEKTIADVTSDPRWKRDSACNYAFGFDQIVTRWMRLTGYRSRWAEDGHWRW